MKLDLVIAGVGGQGIVLASRLIAQCALRRGLTARTAETIGMAQRGGSVVSHVRVGNSVHAPLTPLGSADTIVGFEPAEAVRCLPYLKEGSAVVVARRAVPPVTAALSGDDYDGAEMLAYLERRVRRLVVVDGDAICAACGSGKVLNVALLGAAAAAGALGTTPDELTATIATTLPARFVEMNLQALRAGARAGRPASAQPPHPEENQP